LSSSLRRKDLLVLGKRFGELPGRQLGGLGGVKLFKKKGKRG